MADVQIGCSLYPGAGVRPVVFLHGFLGSRLDWEPICHALREQYRTISLDLPGHGESSVAADTTVENTAEELVRFLAATKIVRPHLVGYSMGGRLALYLAARHGDKFGDVVITSASPGIEDDQQRVDRRNLDDATAERLTTQPLSQFIENWYNQPLFASLHKRPELLRQLRERRTGNDPGRLAIALRALGPGRQPSLWNELATIRNRLLIVAGALDDKYVAISRQMAERAPSARMVIIPEAGHALHLEQPDAYIAALRAFLSVA